MNILVCICTYKRNFLLKNCIQSINNTFKPVNFKIRILIIDNTINNNSKNLVKFLKKKLNLKINYINERKRGVVYARNRALNESKKICNDYICFFDDDCTVDKFWFYNVKKLINKYSIITGPQIYKTNNIFGKNLSSIFEKKYHKNSCLVSWAATNNVIVSKKILLSSNLKFDVNLNKFGMGEDQLFFLQLNKKGHNILWNKKIKVYETKHSHRSTIKWVANRSFRLGILGNYIDKKIYGSTIGNIFSFIKSIYYLFLLISNALKPFQKLYLYKLISFICRSFGRLLGPYLFKKIEFYKK